ncbi:MULTISPECIES: outer membrane protein assembly factor BamD [Acidobacteriaceae]|uniref:outer membrane protein assembly factor BamD n=1 Tax=Acidobacteriaceae TaxID=204434 RepID=UPI00131E056B|nr:MULTISPECIES: outer membrane protein assembly factor BamD [Acidobacteriaceae]MDW5267035.1 outer membrane protein assembly factor BamD [Edaphobacter sp.]
MSERSFFPSLKASALAGVAVAVLLTSSMVAGAQVTGSSQTTTDANGQQQESVTLSASDSKKPKEKKEKVVVSKDTKKELRKQKALTPIAEQDAKLPDKALYDKAVIATKKGHFDVARLDLQTLLNTYPDSQYQMRAKLAIADSWYKEGGTAALMQAESEYKDFITFFPNAPEAAEAQMRVGDIYFRQMDKPDRDYTNATHAEEEYRLMLQQFPESALVPQARQRLREVQEVMAEREAEIGDFYASRAAWPATIARYQTVVDTYPEYSHMDDVLVGLGDAYEAEAKYVRSIRLPEAAKARLEHIYDDQAADAYRKVVLEHSASPHVEDARDRLAAMELPIPKPTAEQVAASEALENSRSGYNLKERARLLVMHTPDTVMAAHAGDPSLTDPKATLAPDVTRKIISDFNTSMHPETATTPAAKPASAATTDAAPADEAVAPAAPAAPLAFHDVPTAAPGADNGSAVQTSVPGATSNTSSGTASDSMGVEIVSPSSAPKPDGGLKAVGPTNNTPLPAIEKAGDSPMQANDIKPGTQPAAQAPNAKGKKTKPGFDKSDESSSKHKKKKGLDKLNPF